MLFGYLNLLSATFDDVDFEVLLTYTHGASYRYPIDQVPYLHMTNTVVAHHLDDEDNLAVFIMRDSCHE